MPEYGALQAPSPGNSPHASPGIKSTHSSEDLSDFDDEDREPTRSTGYLILLTLAIGGLQIAWSVELSSISPFLLSLGLSKSLLALVWIAGPLSGTLVQPYVGIKSDNCRISWGRRRPFIVGGALATMVSLLALCWTREIVAGVTSIFGAASDSAGTVLASQVWAVLFVYVLDFAINVIQAAIRAFIVDCAPTHQQEDANAWASRITGVGNIAGYLSGYVNLPKYLPFFGYTQFQVLVAITCFLLSSTVGISCLSVGERDPRTLGTPMVGEGGVIAFFKGLLRSMRRLPKQIRRICQVQLFAWIGWFPFLFYITAYVMEIYADSFFEENPNMTDDEINEVMEHGTRLGTRALLVFAITTFLASVILPFIIAPTFKPFEPTRPTPLTPATPAATHLLSNSETAEGGYFFHKPVSIKATSIRSKMSWRRRIARLSRAIRISSLTLRRAWLISHIIFTVLMWSTVFVRNTTTATIIIGLTGIPWALTNWAPFALIAAEISKRDAIRRGLRPPPRTLEGQRLAAGRTDGDDSADQAGVVLGIHNVAIAAPQVLATVMSSFIFQALQKPRGTAGDNSIAWVLRICSIFSIGAAWATRRVTEGDEDEDGDVDGDEEERVY